MNQNTSLNNHTSSPRKQNLCPWWICFTFDNALRRLFQNPEHILSSYIQPGWTVLDVGPGMGYFTITLAKLVGNTGKVIAADLQKEMLDGIFRRALKAGVLDRIEFVQNMPDKIGIPEPLDFCLAFWMVHEVQDRDHFLGEITFALKPGGLLLLVEPKLHVSTISYDKTLEIARSKGLTEVERPRIWLSNSILLRK